jgi:hypothetical protein
MPIRRRIYHGDPHSLESMIERQRFLEFVDWYNRSEGEPPLLFAVYEFLINDEPADLDGSGDWCWCQNLSYDMQTAGLITDELELAGW